MACFGHLHLSVPIIARSPPKRLETLQVVAIRALLRILLQLSVEGLHLSLNPEQSSCNDGLLRSFHLPPPEHFLVRYFFEFVQGALEIVRD